MYIPEMTTEAPILGHNLDSHPLVTEAIAAKAKTEHKKKKKEARKREVEELTPQFEASFNALLNASDAAEPLVGWNPSYHRFLATVPIEGIDEPIEVEYYGQTYGNRDHQTGEIRGIVDFYMKVHGIDRYLDRRASKLRIAFESDLGKQKSVNPAELTSYINLADQLTAGIESGALKVARDQ